MNRSVRGILGLIFQVQDAPAHRFASSRGAVFRSLSGNGWSMDLCAGVRRALLRRGLSGVWQRPAGVAAFAPARLWHGPLGAHHSSDDGAARVRFSRFPVGVRQQNGLRSHASSIDALLRRCVRRRFGCVSGFDVVAQFHAGTVVGFTRQGGSKKEIQTLQLQSAP